MREILFFSCPSDKACKYIGAIVTLVGLSILYIVSILFILIHVSDLKFNINKTAVLCVIMLESAGAVFYFIGDNIKYISEVKSKCDINCHKGFGIASVALLGASLVVFLVIPLIHKKCKKMVMKGVKCCPCSECGLNLDCSRTSTQPAQAEFEEGSRDKEEDSHTSEEEASRISTQLAQDKSSKEDHSGWYDSLEMFVIAVKIDAVYSIIEHASNIDVGDLCKENRLGLTITFLVILSLVGVFLLFIYARYICYKNFDDKCNPKITFVSVLMMFIIPSYLLEDNAQPLVCAPRKVKIGISAVTLIPAFGATLAVIYGYCRNACKIKKKD